MSRATPIRHQKISRAVTERKTAVILLTPLAVLVVAYIFLSSLLPAQVKVRPETGSRDVPVDTSILISASWMRGSISNVTVKETKLDPLGNPIESAVINGKLEDGAFVTSDGKPPLKPDSRYDVTVEGRLTEFTMTGPRRRDVTENITFHTIVTPAPIFTKDTQVVPMDEPIVVEFNTFIKSFQYEMSPELPTTMKIDEGNPTRALISFEGYEQGQKLQLTVTDVEAENGSRLQHSYSQTIVTTDPLKVTFVPGDGEAAVNLASRPTLTFSEAIRNQDSFESLVSVEPATLGGWDWVDEKTVEFKPLHDWVKGTEVTIRLKGGPEGLRSESGSFLRQDVESSFTTKPSKMIDVNLTTQTLTLYDNDQKVKSFLISSGSKATPSLTGTYAVYHKAEKVDMQGEGYSAPNVPWVIMFNGDYTIHGNYWATTFGVPSSHGCVGMPVADAEYVYNWTPIGAIVSIHN